MINFGDIGGIKPLICHPLCFADYPLMLDDSNCVIAISVNRKEVLPDMDQVKYFSRGQTGIIVS